MSGNFDPTQNSCSNVCELKSVFSFWKELNHALLVSPFSCKTYLIDTTMGQSYFTLPKSMDLLLNYLPLVTLRHTLYQISLGDTRRYNSLKNSNNRFCKKILVEKVYSWPQNHHTHSHYIKVKEQITCATFYSVKTFLSFLSFVAFVLLDLPVKAIGIFESSERC